MPWNINQVDKFKKGLDEKQKKKWVSIANAVLSKCLEEGGRELECEVKAIRTANARIDNKDESELSNIANKSIWFSNIDKDDKLYPMNCETNPEDLEGYQMAFPIGLFNTDKYGEIIITKTFADRAVKNYNKLKKSGRNIYMDTGHDFGAANAWAKDVISDDDGIKVKWDFTPKGKKLIEDKEYKYYSAAIMYGSDINTGEEMYPILEAVSLTNCPVMYTMPAAHLDNSKDNNTQRDVNINKNSKENKMTIEEIMNAEFSDISNDDKVKLMSKFGIEVKEPKKDEQKEKEFNNLKNERDSLKDVNKELADRLSKIEKSAHEKAKKELFDNAVPEKIKPADREKWEKRYDSNPDTITEIINDLPKLYDFEPVGNGGNTPSNMSNNDKLYADALGLTKEDYKNYENSSKPVKEV